MQLRPPGQERRIREVVTARGHLLATEGTPGLGPGPLGRGQRVGRAQDHGVGAVGERQHGDHLTGLRPLEDVAQRKAGLGRTEVPRRSGSSGASTRRARRARTPPP